MKQKRTTAIITTFFLVFVVALSVIAKDCSKCDKHYASMIVDFAKSAISGSILAFILSWSDYIYVRKQTCNAFIKEAGVVIEKFKQIKPFIAEYQNYKCALSRIRSDDFTDEDKQMLLEDKIDVNEIERQTEQLMNATLRGFGTEKTISVSWAKIDILL